MKFLDATRRFLRSVFSDVTENMQPWFKWSFGLVLTLVVIVLGSLMLIIAYPVCYLDERYLEFKKTKPAAKINLFFSSVRKLFYK